MAKKPARKRPKATKVEKKAREIVVLDLLLDGQTRSFIVRFGAENWQLHERQMDQYIQDATLQITEANKNSAEENLALVTANLWDLVRDNKVATPNVSRQALMDIAKLRGLDKAELTVLIKRNHKHASDEELAAAISSEATT